MSGCRNIKAVTFDIGGTLIEPWPSVGHVYAEVASRHGHPGLPVATLNRQFGEAWRGLKDFQHTRAQWAALVDASFQGLVRPPPSQTFFAEVYDRFSEPDAWHIYPDVLPALEALKARGLRVGVLSNWDDRLRPLLRKLNLYDFFEVLVVSCEAGHPKPSPAIFQEAATQLMLPAHEVLHVGDSLEMDVQGAEAAGFQALLLARGSRSPVPGGGPHLRSLQELDYFLIR